MRIASALLLAAFACVGCQEKNPTPPPQVDAAQAASAPAAPVFTNTDVTGLGYAHDFALKDFNGKLRTMADFKGKAVVIFFGYTQCPDVCPTTMHDLGDVMRQLGPSADKVQVLFITVDPERDTPQLLSQYVPAFDKRFLGLTGTLPEIDKTAKDFHVYYQKVPGKTKDSYSMDHTAGLYIYDPEGRIRVFAGNAAPMDSIVHDLKILLGQPPESAKS
ncbi:MAG TPA: SCO family protein [Burkholderiaceae bacterium]